MSIRPLVLVICQFAYECLFHFQIREMYNAPINVKPQGGGGGGGGGGGADPGEFDILMEARVKFPTPRHLLNVNFPPLG